MTTAAPPPRGPTLAQQLRAERRRRIRRRRAALGGLVLVLVALPSARFVTDAVSRSASAGTTTTSGAPIDLSAAVAPTTTTTSAPTGLHPRLGAALERAQAAAADAGHELTLTSGYRTPEHQADLLEAEVAKRGSREDALWWVFPPETSMHVLGLAIDVGDRSAASWLAEAGVRFGLCRTLSWEWWHFEWREPWESAAACPPPARNPAEAPGVDVEEPTAGSTDHDHQTPATGPPR